MPRPLPCLLLALLAAASPARGSEALDTAPDPVLEARVLAVAAELRCLVCQNQSLADSHAPLAIDLKNQVREQLRDGHDTEQVLAYMTQRYGDFVRYRPPLKPATLLLWLGPALLVLGAGLVLWRSIVSGQARAADAAPLAATDHARALALLSDEPAAGEHG